MTRVRVGLGCAALGNLYSPVSDADAAATVTAAWDRGVRFFDTAPLYGHGLSERRLGQALAGFDRDETVLCTKVGRVLVAADDAGDTIFAEVPPLRPEVDFSAPGVQASLDASLERLGVDRLDVVHVHDPEDHLDQVVAETYPTLARWRDEGVVGAVGLGTNFPETASFLLDRVPLDWLLLAGRCTLLDRSGTEVLDRCASLGVEVVAAGVFNSGLLADPSDGGHYFYEPAPADVVACAREMATACERFGVPLAAAAMQFPLRHPAVAVVLPGARSAAEVEADIDFLDIPIPDDLWAELDAIAPPPHL